MQAKAYSQLTGKYRHLVLAVLVPLLVGCRQAPSGPQPLTEADKQQIDALRDADVKAVLEDNASATAALFEEDGIQLPPNAEMVRGKAEILKWTQAYIDKVGKVIELTETPVEVFGEGGLAYEIGTFVEKATPPGGDTPISNEGKYVVVFRRQDDGSWKYAAVIWNSDQPPASQQGGPSESESN